MSRGKRAIFQRNGGTRTDSELDCIQTIYVIGYNSKLVPAGAVPKRYEDLLNPRWKGQLGWDPEEYYLFGALMKARGREKGLKLWQQLAEQQISFRKGYTLISELVAAGEFPVAVSLYQHRVDEYLDKGAPILWIAPAPTVGYTLSLLAPPSITRTTA